MSESSVAVHSASGGLSSSRITERAGVMEVPGIVVSSTFTPNPFNPSNENSSYGSVPLPCAAESSTEATSITGQDMQIDSPLSTTQLVAIPIPNSPTAQMNSMETEHACLSASPKCLVKPTSVKPDAAAPAGDSTEVEENGNGLKNRRQKRLERNRESARLSRRRRKQYLEVLEERVSQLSEEMDRGRRQHAAQAMNLVRAKRSKAEGHSVVLWRTSDELKVAATFRSKQLQSFCAPPANKFVLWLTLQADDFFRGGRAASERLSAARIGERMLQNGTDRATPSQTMWPLLCNEIGLSYDQEEKVRNYQRTLLLTPDSWLSRHSALSGTTAMNAAHEATQALALAIGSRERRMSSMLTDEQRRKLYAYLAAKQPSQPPASTQLPTPEPTQSSQQAGLPKDYELSASQHVAANLYILNHRLCRILKTVPAAAPMVTGPALKKLSRRPSFESLGARSGEKGSDVEVPQQKPLSRESTHPSSGSLKRCASEMSVDENDGERQPHRPSIDPVEAQASASDVVQKALGHVQNIIPCTPNLRGPAVVSFSSVPDVDDDDPPMQLNGEPLPDPVPVAVLSSTPSPAQLVPPIELLGAAMQIADPLLQHQQQHQAQHQVQHQRQHPGEPFSKQRRAVSEYSLGVVPEEIWSSETAEEILMAFVDEDWAIGGGIETDM